MGGYRSQLSHKFTIIWHEFSCVSMNSSVWLSTARFCFFSSINFNYIGILKKEPIRFFSVQKFSILHVHVIRYTQEATLMNIF